MAKTVPQLVVHAVLDPGASVQEILVEKTLTGAVIIDSNTRPDTLDPINSGGGIPIAGASVTLTGPDGTITGTERQYSGKPSSYGAGRYLVTAGTGAGRLPIRPGALYTLTVRTLDGLVVKGHTTVPNASPVSTTITTSAAFDRQKDTLRLSWARVNAARSYGLRVESPFDAFLIFSDSTKYSLPGLVRNYFAENLERVFIPGFQQASTVFAVDTNYFDYYRSRNDPFTGSGIINHLDGGVGLFGSSVDIVSNAVDVTQPIKQPSLEGFWVYVRPVGPLLNLVDNFTLYVETDNGSSASLSGTYVQIPSTARHEGFAGARDGTRIELQFLNRQDIHSTFLRFIGTISGDSIVGAYTTVSGRAVFRKRG